MKVRIVAIFGRKLTTDFYPYLERVCRGLKKRGVSLICEVTFAHFLDRKHHCLGLFTALFAREDLKDIKPMLLLSVGGDGTFLDSVLYVKDSGIPILGINTGRLGFLANVPVKEIDKAVDYIAEGKYEIEERSLLQLNLQGQPFSGFRYGLNEVTVQKTASSSLLRIHASINGSYLTSYWADGLIVATPTGSTAYSLSGGGPIVSPECDTIILTPVCPHNLSMRALVVPACSVITLKVEGRSGEFMLSLDSRAEKVKGKCELEIKPGDFKLKMVKLPKYSYYETLRNKLGWGEDFRNKK